VKCLISYHIISYHIVSWPVSDKHNGTQLSNVCVEVRIQKKMECNRVSVAQAFHPSYSGGRDQEDPGLKPAQVGSLRDPILKIANTKQLVE
jgi:hypothetical protein